MTVAVLDLRTDQQHYKWPMGQNSRYTFEIKPEWASTLGGMADSKAIVRASCRKCRNMFKVEVELLLAKHGRDYSLYDRTGPCRIYDCDGQCIFMASPQTGTPLRPLLSRDRHDV